MTREYSFPLIPRYEPGDYKSTLIQLSGSCQEHFYHLCGPRTESGN